MGRIVAEDDLPPDDGTFRINAWAGAPVEAPRGAEFGAWGIRSTQMRKVKSLLAPPETKPEDWHDPAVGYGIVLPESDAPAADKAAALDAPECIRELIARRKAPVFRWDSTLKEAYLRRYAADGSVSEPSVGGERGVAANAVPMYLLIVGTPAQIPWAVQYRLQMDACVGRLDLPPAGLEHYIDALLSDWSGADVQPATPVVWAVDHGPLDITRLMRRTIADRIAAALVADTDLRMDGGVLNDARSGASDLIDALGSRKPAFVATSSHGATAPLDDSATLAAQLGVPIDANHAPLALDTLASAWSGHGTIWYAHACCSAGCAASSSFTGVTAPTTMLGRTLTALGALGSRSAPLPQQLLGHAKPARAFVGHVEPTFDWTLRDQKNGQTTTAHIIDAFYRQLFRTSRPPLGLAMQTYYRRIGGLWRDVSDAQTALNAFKPGAEDSLKRLRLIASDLESMVLLGDPTVRLA